MVEMPIYDAKGQKFSCLYLQEPKLMGKILSAMGNADYLAACWQDPTGEVPLTMLGKVLGRQLLVPEPWQELLPDAGVLISSSISGGDLRQRFQRAAELASDRCWLLLERLCMTFPLPCPDGQGVPTEQPEEEGFFSKTLGCRYVHKPGQVILFDTDETLEYKRQLAMEVGFLGWLAP